METKQYKAYADILQQELVPAFGCTEPIAVAFAAAKAREILGQMPEHIVVRCSGNIIKNIKGVIVPASGGLRGIAISALLGAVGGDPELGLECLTSITDEQRSEARRLEAADVCEVELLEGVPNLDIIMTLTAGKSSALVEVRNAHTNICRIEKDGQVIFHGEEYPVAEGTDLSTLTLTNSITFAETVPIEMVQPILENQLKCNLAIAEEGLKNEWGANVGKTLLQHLGDAWPVRAAAYAAAGSDARMAGCEMPVVINSGSGNQGVTASLPVYIYAQHIGASYEKLIRALALSNLTALYQKSQIGKLSAYCGAISAATGSGAAIAWLSGGDKTCIERTITNTIANISGIVCDGAKSSCAAKIASSVFSAVMGYFMASDGNVFQPGEGLVGATVDETVNAYTRMGRIGMASTDIAILNMMIGK